MRERGLLTIGVLIAFLVVILGAGGIFLLTKHHLSQPTTLPPAKAAIQEQYDKMHQTALNQSPSPKNPNLLPTSNPLVPAPANIPSIPAGSGTIYQTGLAPYSGTMFAFQNQWIEQKPDKSITVYAGEESSDETQGVIVVDYSSPDFRTAIPGGGIFPTPTKDGSIRIVGATGEQLNLITTTGTTFTFDIATNKYLP